MTIQKYKANQELLKRRLQVDVFTAKYDCQICHEKFTKRYDQTDAIGNVICPGCKIASISSVKNEEIIMAWVAFRKKERSRLDAIVREGERWTFAPWWDEMISIPTHRDFSIEVELGA